MHHNRPFDEKLELIRSYREKNRVSKMGQIVFTGSSLMEMFPVEEFMGELGPDAPIVYNRGVGGYRTEDLKAVLDTTIIDLKPSALFINIGTNDLSDPDIPLKEMLRRYRDILESAIRADFELERIYLMAYFPVNPEVATPEIAENLKVRTNEKIAKANDMVRKMAMELDALYSDVRIRYVDVNPPLKDDKGQLRAEFTLEGMHVNREGYRAIFPAIVTLIGEGKK